MSRIYRYLSGLNFCFNTFAVIVLTLLFSWQTSQAADSYYEFLKKNNSNPIVLLDQDWQVVSNKSSKPETVSLPYFLPDPVEQLSFKKKFFIADSLRDHKLRIHILGISGVATIRINSKLIHKHLNLLSSFSVNLPAELLVQAGENILEIDLRQATKSEQCIPQVVQIFREKSWLGILREIYLELVPPLSVSDFKYTWSNNKLQYAYTLSLPNTVSASHTDIPRLQVIEKLLTPAQTYVTLSNEQILLSAEYKDINHESLLANVVNWTPSSPASYWLEIVLSVPGGRESVYRFPVYRRQIKMQRDGITIGGSPFVIKGVSYRESYCDQTGRPLKIDEFYHKLEMDFQAIKKLGFNTIRFPHNPPHPYCACLSDSLGLFILIENGIWRLPKEYLLKEYLIQGTHALTEELMDMFQSHPSFLALSLGQEIPVHIPEVQQYLNLLADDIDQHGTVLKYLSPLDYTRLPANKHIDFYFINKYDQSIFSLLKPGSVLNYLISGSTPVVLATVGFNASWPRGKELQQQNEQQIGFAQRFFKLYQPYAGKTGYIWESFQDWPAAIPASVGQKIAAEEWMYTYGLLSWNGEKRDLYQKLPSFMNNDFSEIYENPDTSKVSNFFSICTFICSLIFMLFYQRNYRFKENIKRSLAHPYGFFVDLRDRRIISIINSTVMGIFSNLMVAILLAALVFYNRDNLYFEEIASVLTVPLGIKENYLSILQNPLSIMLFVLCWLYLSQYIVALLLRIMNLFTETKTRFRQLVAMCNWAGAPLILLLPLSMFSLHLLAFSNVATLFYYLLIIFFFWYNYRLGSGIRVFFIMRPLKVLLIVIALYALPAGILLFINGRDYSLLYYLSLLTNARNLF